MYAVHFFFLDVESALHILIPDGGMSCARNRAGQNAKTSAVVEKSQANGETLASPPGAMVGQNTCK